MTFTIYIEWQCPKCYAINHTDPQPGSTIFSGDGRAFSGLVPESMTCAECEAELASRAQKK